MTATLTIALHRSLTPCLPEVKYALRVLARLAGYGYEFVWASGEPADIYYGPVGSACAASVEIDSAGLSFRDAGAVEPASLHWSEGLPLLALDPAKPELRRGANGGVQFTSDIVFAAFWLLSGAREHQYARDARDNFHLGDSFLLRSGLLQPPPVSLYAAFLRRHFAERGKQPEPLPWAAGTSGAAFAISHDVDYPEMIRWVECLRVLAGKTHASRRAIPAILRGESHFWKFVEWVEFARALGTRPAFYFSARQGSLWQYAAGTPDCFYDIHAPRFRELFRFLQGEGCEVGLHASYHAFRSTEQLRREKESLERASGAAVEGCRHHYWRLNPEAPHETLARHQQIGLRYDSSLAFEFYPGFRRGVCHPFRPFHPGERRELNLVELPPAWMDDHFDRRLQQNGVSDPEAAAKGLLDAVRGTGGVALVNYHVRGMNADFFPRYGPWLARFIEKHVDSSVRFVTPRDLARLCVEHEARLETVSADRTLAEGAALQAGSRAELEFGPMRPEDAPAVARLHYEFFGTGEGHGRTIANLGPEFLEEVFYRLNADNPYLFVDVARYRGEIIAFNVYATDGRKVFRETLRRHLAAVVWFMTKLAARRPWTVLSHVFGNVQFFGDALPEPIRAIPAWSFLLGVKPEFRSREFKQRTGVQVAAEIWGLMERTLREQGCDRFWGVVAAHNKPMNEFHERMGMRLVAEGPVQGFPSLFRVKTLAAPGRLE